MRNLEVIANYFIPHRILDIGANVGQFHQFCKDAYPNSFIFSIEASPSCEEQLKQITSNYLIAMLAKDNSVYDFYSRKNDPTCTGNSIYKELTDFYSEEQVEILHQRGVKLDDVFTEDSEFDLIKMDTQGSELDIISGGINLCKKSSGIILEVSLTQYNQGAPLFDDVIRFMENTGFYPVEILDESHNHGSHQQDILFLNNRLR